MAQLPGLRRVSSSRTGKVAICVWQSRRCRFKTANALVVFHVAGRQHRDPGRRSGFLFATKRCHYRYLPSLRRGTERTVVRERGGKQHRSVKSRPFTRTMARSCRYCPATNVLIKFIGRAECNANVNGFRGTGGLAVGNERQQMSHSRRLSIAMPECRLSSTL